MDILHTKQETHTSPVAARLLRILNSKQTELSLQEAVVYLGFPLYRNDDGDMVVCPALIVSKRHGVFIAFPSDAAPADRNTLFASAAELDEVHGHVFSRLLKNAALRKRQVELLVRVESFIYAPSYGSNPYGAELHCDVLVSDRAVEDKFRDAENDTSPLSESVYREVLSTIQGAKGLIRPQRRDSKEPNSRGERANRLESEISAFDLEQQESYMTEFTGPQRIRGLAGSGKTVMLAIRAALLHLDNPKARILVTFYTKSLYQHIRKLITRFYRQFDERDPDWDSVHVLHAWGGTSIPGVYSETCAAHTQAPMSYREALMARKSDPFGYACSKLLESTQIDPSYDYVLIDEGQDFPPPFFQLCRALARDDRFVFAYDELQTIFQASPPSIESLFRRNNSGPPLELSKDIILHKCYRNPREVLVVAHAIGFGIYGSRIVQMLENADHWRDIGYEVESGALLEGKEVTITRPRSTSPLSISDGLGARDIITCSVFDDIDDEVEDVTTRVASDLSDGLRPDDILIITVDDRNARSYLSAIAAALRDRGIQSNNLHDDSYGLVDFRREGRVTLSTVHKAKGNEAFSVYVVGIDSRFPYPYVRDRNIIFTAMTRTKGWLHITGVGGAARSFEKELDVALTHCPSLRFVYPDSDTLTLMKRDLADPERLERAERLIQELTEDLTDGELREILQRKAARPKKQARQK